MPSAEISIGDLARMTGCKVPTIRYYEDVGLLRGVRRSAGNQRRYDAAHVRRLALIQNGRDLGFSQGQIREILALSDDRDRPCESVTAIARAHLDEVTARLSRLSALKTELERMIEACGGRRMADCGIIEALADHSPGRGAAH